MNKRNKIISIALLSLLVVGLVSAKLLTHYGIISSETDFEQTVLVDGESVGSGSLELTDTGGVHTLVNTAKDNVVVKLVDNCIAETLENNCYGVTTTYDGVLELTKKDIVDWTPTGVTGDTIEIAYTIFADKFEYKIISGIIPSGYELVYAMDKQNRFDPENYATVKTVDKINSIGGGLPMNGDYNANPNKGDSYCLKENTFDDYEHCVGAKLWIIPTSDFHETTGKVNWANMADYYYETDLMAYSDNGIGEITLPANGGGINFKIVNTFNAALTPDNYTITTNVVPQ